jgi:hypothetical protein
MRNRFLVCSFALMAILCLDRTVFAQADWTQRFPATSPSARVSPAMANFGDKVLLFGGKNASGDVFGDTWLWDGRNWTQIFLFGVFGNGPTPSPRSDASMAYDPDRGRVVMFGGVDANNQILSDTWIFELQSNQFLNRSWFNWGQPALDISPPARDQASMAFDPLTRKIILTGGFGAGGNKNDVWSFEPDSSTLFVQIPASWTDVTDHTFLPARSLATMDQCGNNAGDPSELLLFGGSAGLSALSDSWISTKGDANNFPWLGPINPSTRPAGRFEHRMAYYPVSNRVVLFGGGAPGQVFTDTWNALCGNNVTWAQASPLHNPGSRRSMGMATGPSGRTVVLFGGIKLIGAGTPTTSGPTNETWTWGRRATCLPTDGSIIAAGSDVDCDFDLIDGATFYGWTADGFSPQNKTKLHTVFRAQPHGPAAITAEWTEADGAHTQTYTYTITDRK